MLCVAKVLSLLKDGGEKNWQNAEQEVATTEGEENVEVLT